MARGFSAMIRSRGVAGRVVVLSNARWGGGVVLSSQSTQEGMYVYRGFLGAEEDADFFGVWEQIQVVLYICGFGETCRLRGDTDSVWLLVEEQGDFSPL